MQGHVIVVTGAFGILGSAVAVEAAKRGANVAALDVGGSAPPEFHDIFLPSSMAFGGVDLSDPAAADRVFAAVKSHFGHINGLVNIAGGFRWETVNDGETATWDKLYTLNVRTALNASRAAIPFLLASNGGSITNIGANGAVKAGMGMGAYAASKSGVHRLTEALSEELKAKNIRVNAVLPSIIDTPLNRADMPDADFSKWVSPHDLAGIILFLASEQAKAITGALIPVTGGV